MICTESGSMLYFGGTAYFALPSHKGFQRLLAEGMRRYGNNFGGSPNANLRLKVYQEAQTFWQTYMEAEKAILVSSGFMAGQLVAWSLRERLRDAPETRISYAPFTHPALWSGWESKEHTCFQEWLGKAMESIEREPSQSYILVCNALDAAKAQLYDFSPLNALPAQAKLTLVADDSHGIGITGPEGKGIFPILKKIAEKITNLQIIVVASLAKACGLQAGLILTNSPDWGSQLEKSPFYAGASPCAPAYAYASMKALPIWEKERKKLLKNIAYFAEKIHSLKLFQFVPNYPVFYTEISGLYEFLVQNDIVISAFPYPEETSPLLQRIVINSAHTFQDMDRLTSCIDFFLKNIYSS
ncbi:MAG: hypothetical protein RMJ44_06195 [Cytophagales bacterium]|nr:hypothetical protein [Cytophagales bacterium]